MQAENNNDIAITEAKLKDFLSWFCPSEGIVVDIRRTYMAGRPCVYRINFLFFLLDEVCEPNRIGIVR